MAVIISGQSQGEQGGCRRDGSMGGGAGRGGAVEMVRCGHILRIIGKENWWDFLAECRR